MQASERSQPEQTRRQTARAVPIYVFGDSTTLIYRDRVWTSEESGDVYITRTMYRPSLSASTFSDEDGNVDAAVIAGLRSESLLVEDENGELEAYNRTRQEHWRLAAVLEGRPKKRPIVTFAVGSLDVPAIVTELGTDIDFEVPGELATLGPIAGATRSLAFEDVIAVCREYFVPLERGIRTLQRLGLDALALHSLPPPQDRLDELYRWLFNRDVPVRLRVKIVATTNMALREVAERTGVPYLDSWPLLANRGLMRPEYSYDAFHFNELAVTRLAKLHIATLEAAFGTTRAAVRLVQEPVHPGACVTAPKT